MCTHLYEFPSISLLIIQIAIYSIFPYFSFHPSPTVAVVVVGELTEHISYASLHDIKAKKRDGCWTGIRGWFGHQRAWQSMDPQRRLPYTQRWLMMRNARQAAKKTYFRKLFCRGKNYMCNSFWWWMINKFSFVFVITVSSSHILWVILYKSWEIRENNSFPSPWKVGINFICRSERNEENR